MGDGRHRGHTRAVRRGAGRVAAMAVAALVVIVPADRAAAHDPIFVDDDTPPEQSPRILDGSVSFATYGVIEEPGGSGHLRVDLEDGDELVVELLVPDRPPENTLADFSHLQATVEDPTGARSVLAAGAALGTFDEPFTGTSYLRLIERRTPAVPGTHTITVTSGIPTRFTLATGVTEQFGTPVEGYERRPLSELDSWYSVPPPTLDADPTVDPDPTGAPGASDGQGAPVGPELPDGSGEAGGASTPTGPDAPGDDGDAAEMAAADDDSGPPTAGIVVLVALLGAGAAGGVLALRRRGDRAGSATSGGTDADTHGRGVSGLGDEGAGSSAPGSSRAGDEG